MHETQNFSLAGRAFKVMRSGIYFIVIASLGAELVKIWFYANQRTCDVTIWIQNDGKFQKSTGLKFCGIDVLQELLIAIVVMTPP